MRSEKEIKELIEDMKKFVDNVSPFECHEFCVVCRKEASSDCFEKHVCVHQCFEHAGVVEWIRALKWVLGEVP